MNAAGARSGLFGGRPGPRRRCRPTGRVAALGVIVVWITALPGWALAAATPSQISQQPSIPGAAVAAALAAGRSFDGSDVRIIGDVDLRRLRVVRAELRCLRCDVQGRLLARDVRFTDVVDLSGSVVTGRVDFLGAIFGRGLAWRDGVIDGAATARLAVFRDVVDADGLVFAGTADFTDAHFQAAASFAAADFHGPALFGGATFGAAATFTAGTPPPRHRGAEPRGCPRALAGAFAADAVFTGTTFAAADFRGRCFHGAASFAGVIVRGPAAFDSDLFLRGVVFEYATVAGDLSFRAAVFAGPADLTGVVIGGDLCFTQAMLGRAVFEHAGIAGDLSFQEAQFSGLADLTGVVIGGDLRFDQAAPLGGLWLTGAAVTGTLSFLLTAPGRHGTLRADRWTAGGVVFDPSDIAWVDGLADQVVLLQRVERTARVSRQIDLANNARFTWLSELGDAHHGISGISDRLVYRGIAGYLVRPFYPLRALVIVILAGIVVNAMVIGRLWRWPRRTLRRTRRRRGRGTYPPRSRQVPPTTPVPAQPRRRPPLPRRLARFGRSVRRSSFVRAVVRAVPLTLRAVLWRRPTDPELPPAARFWTVIEYWLGKALIVVFLTCVANANPTLHQFIDALVHIRS